MAIVIKIMEIIMGVSVAALFLLIFWTVPNKLTDLQITVMEWIKPGMWYSRSTKKQIENWKQIHLVWCMPTFLVGMWGGMLHVHPFLVSIAEGKVVVHPDITYILLGLLTLAIARVALKLTTRPRKKFNSRRTTFRAVFGILMPMYFALIPIGAIWYYLYPFLIGK